MPIEALPLSTAKRICSAQVIFDPCSVVKELLDNSLDARATSASVEISSNTLDVIQIRDNGHGIPHEDRTLVCVRHCTSKLRDISELHIVGGTWLGFRGQALSSLVEISGGLSITTRVEGEIAAEKLEIGKDGGITRREIVSHPVGTTVCTTDLFRHLPVRKQTALNSAAACLARMKKLLQTYALAKPNVRLSLKILKAKTDNGAFTYAPKSNGAGVIEDAACKVIGRACASQCVWTTFGANGLELQAFLPRADADPAKISGFGSFISVDSRPVSANRGTLKQIASKCRDAIRKSHPNLEGVKDPFLVLNIVCPPGSYDPNVEPAKDDVLFDDSEMVINAAEKLLASFYSVLERPDELSFDANEPLDTIDDEPASLSPPPHERDDENVESTVDELTDPSSEDHQEAAEILGNVNLSNPWTIARMAARRNNNINANAGTVSNTNTRRQGRRASPTRLPQDEITDKYLPNIGSIKESNLVHAAELTPSQSYPRQLPTPFSSSSPACATPETTKKQRRQRAQGKTRIPYVSPVQPNLDRNWFQFAPSPNSQRPRVVTESRSRDIRDFVLPNPKASNARLVVRRETDNNRTRRGTSAPFAASNSRPRDHRFLDATDTQVEPDNAGKAIPQENGNTARRRSHKDGLHRTESSLLPLERIPEDAKIQDILVTLRLNQADISSYMSMLSNDSNHPKWLTLPDSPSTGFLPLPEGEELKHWCNRLRTYLHPVLNSENEFEDFQQQIDEAFTRLD